MGGVQVITKTRTKTKFILALGWLGSAIVAAVVAGGPPGNANKPDLTVSAISAQEDSSGRSVYTVTVQNQGNAGVSGKVDVLNVLLDVTYGVAGNSAQETRAMNLAPGESSSFQLNKVGLRYNQKEVRYIRVIVDSSHQVDELEEGNNGKDGDVPLPDLAVTNVNFDAERRTTFTISNQGLAPTHRSKGGEFSARWYGPLGSSEVLGEAVWDLPELLPGESITQTWTAPPSGTKSLSISAKPISFTSDQQVFDLDVQNNSATKLIPLPDFTIGTPTFDASKRPTIPVINQGNFSGGPLSQNGVTIVWLDKDKNPLPSPAAWTLPQILPAQTLAQTATSVPPPAARWVRSVVDPGGQLVESNENNNQTPDVRLPFPELALYGSYNSASGKVEGRVANEGDLSIDAFVIWFAWLDASGATLGNQQSFTLTDTNDSDAVDDNNDNKVGAGESVGFAFDPHPNAVGVRVTVDPLNQIAEWDESAPNNVKEIPLLDTSVVDQLMKQKAKKPKL